MTSFMQTAGMIDIHSMNRYLTGRGSPQSVAVPKEGTMVIA